MFIIGVFVCHGFLSFTLYMASARANPAELRSHCPSAPCIACGTKTWEGWKTWCTVHHKLYILYIIYIHIIIIIYYIYYNYYILYILLYIYISGIWIQGEAPQWCECCFINIINPMNTIWLVVCLPLWKIWVRQLGLLFPICGNNVPNHQPAIVCYRYLVNLSYIIISPHINPS